MKRGDRALPLSVYCMTSGPSEMSLPWPRDSFPSPPLATLLSPARFLQHTPQTRSHTHTCPHTLTRAGTQPHMQTRSFTHTLTHLHTHVLSQIPSTLTHRETHTLECSHRLTPADTHRYALTDTPHRQTHIHTYTVTHTLTHTLTCTHALPFFVLALQVPDQIIAKLLSLCHGSWVLRAKPAALRGTTY